MKQIVRAPTTGRAVLDLIVTDMSEFYKEATILPPIANSDHTSVLWEPNANYQVRPTTASVFSRPIPDSTGIRRFGQWVTTYG